MIYILISGFLLIGLGVWLELKSKTKNIELEISFIKGGIESVIDNFKTYRNIEVAGILGIDFLDKYKYVIDFRKYIIRHKSYTISFKGAMEILNIPFIVLWQNNKKYIFVIDTGSTNCHISNKAANDMDCINITDKAFITSGSAGSVLTNNSITAKMYYKQFK